MNSGSAIPSKTIGRTKLVGALLLTAIVISLLARLGQFEDRVYDWFQQYQYQSGSDQILLVTSDPESIGNSKLWTAAWRVRTKLRYWSFSTSMAARNSCKCRS